MQSRILNCGFRAQHGSRISDPTLLLSSSLLPNSIGWQSVFFGNISFQRFDMF